MPKYYTGYARLLTVKFLCKRQQLSVVCSHWVDSFKVPRESWYISAANHDHWCELCKRIKYKNTYSRRGSKLFNSLYTCSLVSDLKIIL